MTTTLESSTYTTPIVDVPELPYCNLTIDNKSYYSENPLKSTSEVFFNTLTLGFCTSILISLTIALMVSFSSSGTSSITILTGVTFTSILTSVIYLLVAKFRIQGELNEKCL